jgi:hypothetical protein
VDTDKTFFIHLRNSNSASFTQSNALNNNNNLDGQINSHRDSRRDTFNKSERFDRSRSMTSLATSNNSPTSTSPPVTPTSRSLRSNSPSSSTNVVPHSSLIKTTSPNTSSTSIVLTENIIIKDYEYEIERRITYFSPLERLKEDLIHAYDDIKVDSFIQVCLSIIKMIIIISFRILSLF